MVTESTKGKRKGEKEDGVFRWMLMHWLAVNVYERRPTLPRGPFPVALLIRGKVLHAIFFLNCGFSTTLPPMQEHDTLFLLFPFLSLFMLCYACFSSFGIGHLLLLRLRHLSHGSQNKPVSSSFLNIALPLSLLQCSKLFSFGEKEGSIFSAIHPHTGKVRERVYLRRRVRDTKKAVQTHTYPLTAVSRTFDSIFLSLLCFLFFLVYSYCTICRGVSI